MALQQNINNIVIRYSVDMLHVTHQYRSASQACILTYYNLNNSMAAFVLLIMYSYIPIATTTAYHVKLAIKTDGKRLYTWKWNKAMKCTHAEIVRYILNSYDFMHLPLQHRISNILTSELVIWEYIWTDFGYFNEYVIDKRSSYCVVLFGNNNNHGHTITTR